MELMGCICFLQVYPLKGKSFILAQPPLIFEVSGKCFAFLFTLLGIATIPHTLFTFTTARGV